MDDPREPDGFVAPADDDEQFTLTPADGLSEAERIHRSRTYPPVSVPESPRRAGQFTVAGLLAVTFFVALGLSGQSWVSAQVYAGVMGLLALLALIWAATRPAESAASRLVWWGITVAYFSAVVAALVRQLSS